jgi:hypothetical protein
MIWSTEIDKVAEALAKANAELKSIGKDRTNPHFKNKYATLDAIMDAIRPSLAKHGLSVVQGAKEVTDGFNVVTMLIHSSGQFVSNVVPVPLSKQDAQGVGSALTYGRRYGVSSLLALATDEDDDGNQASKAKPEPAKRAEPPKPEPKADDREWDGTDTDAASFLFPVKGSDSFGKPMGGMSDEALQKFIAWAGVKPEYINARIRAEAILGGRYVA